MNTEKEVSKPIFKATLLAISLFIMMPSVISPALPLMEKAFPNIPRVTVELLTTIPPKEITATSVVPPPISTTMFPVGSEMSIPAPIAAAIGSSIK